MSETGHGSRVTESTTVVAGWRTASADSETTPATGGVICAPATSEVFAPFDAPMSTICVPPALRTAVTTVDSSPGGAAALA
jgi:hypothetical protein